MRVEKRKQGDAMDKMWICKTCGVEIAASTKSCPSISESVAQSDNIHKNHRMSLFILKLYRQIWYIEK